MTDLRSFFNILLLSISLATVILTIISFLVFKVRYALKNQFNSNLFNLKGSYFNRYAPHLEKKNKESQDKFEKEVANRKLSPQMKIGLSFGSVFVFIVFALSAENFLVHRKKLNPPLGGFFFCLPHPFNL